jgi:hypothetical protein
MEALLDIVAQNKMTPLWEMETSWFSKAQNELGCCDYPYKSWQEFNSCKPHKTWKPYSVVSWSWSEDNQLQIVFLWRNQYTKIHRVCIDVNREEEPQIREWLKRHMPIIWKL